jgi:hypothetical protein
MTVYRFVLAAVAAAALVTVAPEANSKGGTPITSCGQSVTTNAVLTQDLACAGGGITVNAPNVTIDLNGHTLTGDGGAVDNGVWVLASKVTVKNGVLRGFGTGLLASGVVDHLSIVNVAASGNSVFGFDLEDDSISVASSSASANNSDGIIVFGNAFSIKSSTTSSNGGNGINIDGAASKITSVISSGNRSRGISVIHGTLASVRSSSVSGNGDDGMVVSGTGAQVKGNRAEGNGFANGVSDSSGLGINVLRAVTGKNYARGNDDPAECNPATLC